MAGKTTWGRSRALRFAATTLAAALTLTLVAGVVPTVVSADAATRTSIFTSKIAASTATTKLAATTEQPLSMSFTTRARTQTTIAPVVTTRTTTRTAVRSSSAGTGDTAAVATAPAGDELAEAQSILAGLIAQYPILAGTTVSIGDANGYQAIAYYKSGRIVISPTHTASLSRILSHEVWHVIDWRDNGVIDWGESVPPK